MKINKLASYIAIAGVFVALIFCYSFYRKAFTANTNFSEQSVFINIPTDAPRSQVQDSLKKYIKDSSDIDFILLIK